MPIIDFPCNATPPKTLKDWPWDTELGKPYWDTELGKPYMDINTPTVGVPKNAINPDHYKRGGVECIQLTERLSFCLGNVVKYIFRFDKKGGLQDLLKAKWYLDREIERLQGQKDRNDLDHYNGC